MTEMNAAVVNAWGEAPRYQSFTVPEPRDGEIVVDVLAAGLHPRVRTGAGGTHYTSTGKLPMIPGVDGVARRADGTRIYFVADDDVIGTMADKAVIDPRRSVEIPENADAVRLAAAMNPAMSAWVALRRRVPLVPGQTVLVLGATGNAGAMACQIAKLLGAGHVIAAGRNAGRLAAAPADTHLALTDLAKAAEADVVLDYLWGEPTQNAIVELLTSRADRSRELNWIQIGSVAGPTIELPSVALRSANFRLQGNGQGSVSTRAYLAELPALITEIEAGHLTIETRPVPLADVEPTWQRPDVPGERVVFVP